VENSRESGELVTGEARQGSTLPKLQSISFSGPATVIRDVSEVNRDASEGEGFY
jgi:hypothetical protein